MKQIHQVAIIMGSDSDLPVMKGAADILERLSVSYHLTVVSAHRTPDKMVAFAKGAREAGFSVIIAGAGGAAHLPGMVAAYTTLPVIGVPIQTAALHGVDSLYSIVQMPGGIPVATVAINGALNAGLLAARILGSHDKKIADKLSDYQEKLRCMVEEKALAATLSSAPVYTDEH